MDAEDPLAAQPRAGTPLDGFWEALYGQLRDRAEQAVRRAGSSPSVQPTLLLHEAFLKLASWRGAGAIRDRVHFLAVATRALRETLVDLARQRQSQKAGGGLQRVTLTGVEAAGRPECDAVELDDALAALAAECPRPARAVELRAFAGLSIDEIAAEIGVSPRTVDLDLRFARAWLDRALRRGGER